MGLKGIVYDVSSNEVYKKNGSYCVFSGKDASVAMAKMRFDPELFEPSKH